MLPADADLECGADAATGDHRGLDQRTDPALVEHLKGIVGEDALFEIRRQESTGIVATQAEDGLCQIVRPEGKELGVNGDLIGRQCGAGELDHGAHEIGHGLAHGTHDLGGNARDHGLLVREFTIGGHQWDHDLRAHINAAARRTDGRFEDGSRLHLRDLRIGHAQAASTVPQHRIDFPQSIHDAGQLLA